MADIVEVVSDAGGLPTSRIDNCGEVVCVSIKNSAHNLPQDPRSRQQGALAMRWTDSVMSLRVNFV